MANMMPKQVLEPMTAVDTLDSAAVNALGPAAVDALGSVAMAASMAS